MKISFRLLALTLLVTLSVSAQTSKPAIDLRIDATDVPRKILHGRMSLAVSPGPLTLVYPQWIPGEHGPTGPVVDFTGLHFSGNGQDISWTRDSVSMYDFHLVVPAGVSKLDITFDQLLPASAQGFTSAASSTANLDVLSWNQILLYPAGTKTDDVQFTAHLKMPKGWKYGTALPIDKESTSKDEVDFKSVSLTTLVDSPVIMGSHFRHISLGNDMGREHYIEVASDSEAALDFPPEVISGYKRLVAETGALFGARHYNEYHFLLTLSDGTAHFGLEHHEGSDDRVAERTMVDHDMFWVAGHLLPHEMTHSWNGKYRRPAGLSTPNFQEPMKGDLLWVYEGLTQYLGEVLAARSGIWTPEQFREFSADTAAALDHTSGRTWRPLQDTATGAQILYGAAGEWESWRRSVDYYPEGFLIWLEADTIIRQKTNGQKSLNDFCRAFHGGQSGPPKTVPYTFEDVVNGLNSVVANDWRKFLTDRLDTKSPRAPLGGIQNGGWKLVYTDVMPVLVYQREDKQDTVNALYSIGFALDSKGDIKDVLIGSPAEKAGIGPGMKLVAVNGRAFTPRVFHDALRIGKGGSQPLELLVANGEFFKTYSLDYHDGEKFPHLVRDGSTPDLLSDIIKPLTK